MSDWTSGYVAELDYPFAYFPEINPLRARFALLSAGVAPPRTGPACELGFGQGMSINLHAAASGTAWSGCDFLPSQAAFAQELAEASAASATLSDEAFDAFCARADLPDFDFIGLHGVWSWVSEENRRIITGFIARKLRPGGVVYVGYNVLAGRTGMLPLRHLLTAHAETAGAPGQGLAARIDAAMEFAARLMEQDPLYARANPLAAERIERLRGQSRAYLAHEYFNRDWRPMAFGEAAALLAEAKLGWGASAALLDQVDALNLTAGQQAFLREIADPVLREDARDLIVNQQFRRDYWVKGVRRLTPFEQVQALRNERLVLTTPRAEVKLTAAGSLGEVSMQEAVYAPILDLMADHKPRTLGEIEAGTKGVGFAQVAQAALVLVGKGDAAPAQDETTADAARAATDRLNAALVMKSRTTHELHVLASPVTGGGVTVERLPQLFLAARAEGRKSPADWARWAWPIMEAQGQALAPGGEPLATPEANLAELTRMAKDFADLRLPMLKALGVA